MLVSSCYVGASLLILCAVVCCGIYTLQILTACQAFARPRVSYLYLERSLLCSCPRHFAMFRQQSWSTVAVAAIAELLSKELRTALRGCFFTFAQRLREAAGLTQEPASQAELEQQERPQQPKAPVTDAMLLLLHGSCAHVRSNLLAHALSR